MDYVEDAEIRMMDAIENLDSRLSSIRAGRANPSMLSKVEVEAYGSMAPLSSVANITVPEARELMVKPYDKSLLKDIEKAIYEANLGINPTNNGEIIILKLPDLTEDRRREYVKLAKTEGENTKIALRNIRQDVNNDIKAAELREDEEKDTLNDIQELINKYNKIVEEKIKEKESELMSI